MKRVAIYVRVSTQEQKKHGISVDSQISALETWCKDNNYQIAGIYNDAGISARKKYTKRPALLKLINDCKANKIDLIAFTKLDRWFRSVADYYEVQTQLDAYKVPWRAIWEDYETETSAGCFKVNIMLSVAQAEADRTSERIKSVFAYQVAQGKYVGSVPFGYIREKGQLKKDPETSKYIDLIFKTYLASGSTTKTIRTLYDNGYNISRSGLWHVLNNPIYSGTAKSGYKSDPYISKADWDRVNNTLSSNHVPKKANHEYIFSGLCVCAECGYNMRAMARHDVSGKYYNNYYCNGTYNTSKHATSVSLSEIKIEKYLLKNIDKLIADYNAVVEVAPKGYVDVSAKKKKLEEKLKRVGIRFEEGDISAEEYKEKRKAILSDIASLNPQTESTKITLPDNWLDVYNSLDQEHKKIFWRAIISKITIAPKNAVDPVVEFI